MTAIPAITDHLPIAIRAFAVPAVAADNGVEKRGKGRRAIAPASPWTLIFDTETTTDAGQALRFGTYQLRYGATLDEEGIFYDPQGVTLSELECIKRYAVANGLALRNRDDFVDDMLFARAFRLRATIVGFNLPFDISRLAISHGSARTPTSADVHAMRGAFTFKISEQKIYPHIRVKHMSSRAASIQFAATMGQNSARGARKRGLRTPARRGHFIDVKTLAGALFSRNFSLSALAEFLEVAHQKLAFEKFDAPVTDEMIRYAVEDVRATWDCYRELLGRFDRLGLQMTRPEKVYSEASIGKGYLRQMGIKPWREVQPEFPPDILSSIMSSYFGGRSEVRIRREMRQVILCDFLSMYPTVCTLMGLWRFVIAKGMTYRNSTAETRELLNRINPNGLQDREVWSKLTTLVRVRPQGDIFPVRAAYRQEAQNTIGANHLTTDMPLWFTLADCVASKLLTGRAPDILEAISFYPGSAQPDLQSIAISGNEAYRVDPVEADFFKRVIELRQSIKRDMKSAHGGERDRLNTEQNALKICANSTSYGIWVEVNVETRATAAAATVHSSTSSPFFCNTNKRENPGSYFHPLLATLITGAARLMLAIAERLVVDSGMEWSFCDTDSIAIARPADMGPDVFANQTAKVVNWFTALNPYDFGGSILKVEDVNQSLSSEDDQPLYCFAVSSKRYALFNLDDERQPVLRKVSAHGLGHWLAPYDNDTAPPDFPIPDASVLETGVRRWHCDLWHQIITADLAGHPDQVHLNYHPALQKPAVSRYSATTPALLRWFKRYNADRPYRDRVKPFGFLLSMSARRELGALDILHKPKRGRPKSKNSARPVAPFDKVLDRAVTQAFDRQSGSPIAYDTLKSFAEAVGQYHLQPESKFVNGDFMDHGPTRRRHVHGHWVRHIGKEANNWERQSILGYDPSSAVEYHHETARTDISARMSKLVAEFKIGDVAQEFGISKYQLNAFLLEKNITKSLEHHIILKSSAVEDTLRSKADIETAILIEIAKTCSQHGLRVTAREMGIDPSNLRRRLFKLSG